LPRIKAVLFDLDETLLELDSESFLSSYLHELATQFSDVAPREEFTAAVWSATEAMLESTDASLTNQEVFMEAFFSQIEAKPYELMPRFDRFYREVFPRFRCFGRPHPQGRAVVSECLDRGLEAVVATNPVFPRPAVEERLKWAEIQDLPFALVTTYEIMRYCKPHPGYFLEIARELAVDPSDCLMVGDDPEMDLAGAREVGMRTYHVIPGKPASDFEPDGRGDLRTLLSHLG